MAGTAQRDHARRDAGGSDSRSLHNFRNCPAGRNPGGGTVTRGGVDTVDARDTSAIEDTIAGFARGSNSGLIVTASPSAMRRRELIIALAAKHRLPAVYAIRIFVADGGLIS